MDEDVYCEYCGNELNGKYAYKLTNDDYVCNKECLSGYVHDYFQSYFAPKREYVKKVKDLPF